MAARKRERAPLADVPANEADALELVRSLARRLHAAEEEYRRLRDQFDQAVTVARMFDFSWVTIAEASGPLSLSPALVQQRATPLVDPAAAPSRQHSAVSPTEAASRLGVSRETVYRMLRDGRLQVINDPSGRKRVVLENGAAGDPASP